MVLKGQNAALHRLGKEDSCEQASVMMGEWLAWEVVASVVVI